MRSKWFRLVMLATPLAMLTGHQVSAQPAPARPGHGLATPEVIVAEHRQLRDALARALADRGAVGDAAKTIERTLTPHLKHEEDAILPPLGLLRSLVDGQDVADAKAVTTVVQGVERELPQLLTEHRAILDGAKRLRDASEREGKREYLQLADQLWTHAIISDQVLFPASILVGRYVTLQEGAKPRAKQDRDR